MSIFIQTIHMLIEPALAMLESYAHFLSLS